MINMDAIEKAYLRFKNLHDNLVFRVNELEDDKDKKTSKYEIRCMNRFITVLHDKEEAEDLVRRMNESTQQFIVEEYSLFLDKIDKANEQRD